MRMLITLVMLLLTSFGPALAQAKLEVAELDAWLVRDPQMSTQFAVADQMGYFKAEGLKITPRWYIAGTDLPSMWGAGNIHLGTATASMIIPIAASGGAIYSIAPQSDIGGAQQIVLGKKGQEIVRAPKDFEKLKVGMPKGASVTMAIQNMARDTGVDFTKIQFVNLAPPDSVAALAEGDIDAMAGWAPRVFNAVKQAGGKAVLRALVKATDTVNTQREAVVKIVAKEMKMDEGLARDIMALNVYSMEQTDQHARGMGEFIDFLHSLDRIKQKFPPENVFVTKLLEEVDPKLVKWKSKTDVR